jgi:hypothetical protein
MQMLGAIGILWGLAGFLGLITSAMIRLTPMAADAFRVDLHPIHWVVLSGWTLFMVYSEAYRGFHRAFAPRFGARMRHLFRHPCLFHVALAPAYGMCLIHATTKRKCIAWGMIAGIVMLVVLVRQVSQPWRGIIDFGVVLGLALGGLSTIYFTIRALVDASFAYPCETPETA